MQCSLNVRVQRRRTRLPPRAARVSVAFDGIEALLVDCLRTRCASALVCIAWLRAPAVLRAVPRGSRAIVTNDVRLPAYRRAGIVARKVGRARGSRRALMHNKFVVGRDASGTPAWVLVGSYNATAHSRLNTESVVLIEDATIAQGFADEFDAIWQLGRPCA